MNSRGIRLVSAVSPLLLTVLTVFAGQALAQIPHVKDINTEQIRALDRDKTVVLLPGGILEQHGPYLPAFADGYQNERLTQELANAIVERPGWQVLVFPLIPLGVGGANEIGGKYVFSGTYAVRFATLRAVFMDLASELGEQGFRWVFVVHLHGAPNHNRALDQAGDYFHDSYGGHMVNLTGLLPAREARTGAAQQLMSEEARQEEGFAAHASMNETSRLLFNGFDAGDITPIPPFTTMAEAVAGYLGAVGIKVQVRTMERAAHIAAWRGKKLQGVIVGASGANGNAATRLENYVVSWGEFSYGGYPDLDDLFKQQAQERNPTRRERLLHDLQRLVQERVMFAPLFEFVGLHVVGPRVEESGLGLISLYPWSGPYEEVRLK